MRETITKMMQAINELPETEKQLIKERFSKFMATSVVFSPDGETLTAGVSEGTILMWNVKTGKRLKTLQPNKHAITKTVPNNPE